MITQRDENDYLAECKKFTDADELCRLNQSLETTQSIRHPFNNYLEAWESIIIYTKNDINIEKLKTKYMHVHFYDADADEDHNSDVYRVVNQQSERRE